MIETAIVQTIRDLARSSEFSSYEVPVSPNVVNAFVARSQRLVLKNFTWYTGTYTPH
jgi:hypothetical protein